eukprot:m.460601 g.460601  ORF g.460601 m.460601 type:complete len:57 (-) comp22075_c0_seq1:89-259(-)
MLCCSGNLQPGRVVCVGGVLKSVALNVVSTSHAYARRNLIKTAAGILELRVLLLMP